MHETRQSKDGEMLELHGSDKLSGLLKERTGMSTAQLQVFSRERRTI